jgi:MerR family transcriptional regulator, light-induced transcriptional regulator
MTNDRNTEAQTSPHNTSGTSNKTIEQIAEAYVIAAIEGDRVEALRVLRVDGIDAGHSISQLYLGVIQVAQYRIGQLWADGEITVSQEHLATGISQLAIAQLYTMMSRGVDRGPCVVLTCVPGENHDMGPRILADFYEMAGFDVRFLGADIPLEDILHATERFNADIVALSTTMTYNIPAFRETVLALRSRFGEKLLIAAGGQALELNPELIDELAIPLHASDARRLVQISREALGLSSINLDVG